MRGSITKRCRIVEGRKQSVYHIRYRIGPKQCSRSIGPNKKEAERILAETVSGINNGTYSLPTKTTFAEFSEKWLNDYALPHVKPSTKRSYSSVIETSINPAFGHYPISKITTSIIQNYIAKVILNKKAGKTANNHLVLLKTMFKHARKWKFIQVSPTDDIEPAKTETKEMDFLEPSEIRLLIKHSEEPYRTLFMTAILTGMRRGELLGLQWGDVDWQANQIRVRRSLFWQTNAEAKEQKSEKRAVLGTPKTKKSIRSIVMSPELKKALEIHRIKCTESPDELVFCNKLGKPIEPENMIRRHFHPTLTLAGLRRIRFHDLRHTFTSLLIAQNPSPKFVQSQLGHASIQTTFDRYGHLFKVDAKEIGTRLDATVFSEAPEKQAVAQEASNN